MKFGKEFVSQMVPEWQEAYMNYDHLKKLLRDIKIQKQRNPPAPASLMRQISSYRGFSGLIRRRDEKSPEKADEESQAILVHAVNKGGSMSTMYETTFLTPSERGGEYELVFFRRLDEEFNKVERFYRSKVDEVMLEAEELDKQMDALVAFRVKVGKPAGIYSGDRETEIFKPDVSNDAGPSVNRRIQRMDSIDESSSFRGISGDANKLATNKRTGSGREKLGLSRPPSLEVLNNVTFHNDLETPRSTIKGILKIPKNTELSFTYENLKKVEYKLNTAFVEFYHKLRLLRNFSFLNTEAFSKIMKKHDKITSRNTARAYMKMVDNSYLGSSEEVPKLMESVENAFVKHFANSNRSKGMRSLRPIKKQERHRVMFSVGFFAGFAVALVLALFFLIRARNIINQPGTSKYMETLFPLYSLFGFVVLHMGMYAGNIYFWRKYRVNYAFIFGFKQGTELGYGEVLLVSFVLAVCTLVCVLGNLDMEMDPETKDYKAITELLPLILVIVVFLVLFCPFDIIYRSSRFMFLGSLSRALLAPLYKVTLPDFVLADQLTSQVQAFRSLEFYICYYGWGDYKHRQDNCSDNHVFMVFYFVVAVVPHWSRLLQCVRRLIEEGDETQGWNALKYLLTIMAVCSRTAYSRNKGIYLKVVAGFFSAAAAIYGTYWDFVKDWGLLNKNSKNKWLRDRLLVPHTSIYYGAIVLNVVLKFAWLQNILELKVSIHRQVLITIVASLEIIRRGIWTFFRLENEHLSNVGKFRAFKFVPLPFSYDDDDDDGDREN